MYMWSFVGHSVLQCFTGGTWIDYRLAASGDLPEYMEVWPEEKIWKIPESRTVGGIIMHHCYGHV